MCCKAPYNWLLCYIPCLLKPYSLTNWHFVQGTDQNVIFHGESSTVGLKSNLMSDKSRLARFWLNNDLHFSLFPHKATVPYDFRRSNSSQVIWTAFMILYDAFLSFWSLTASVPNLFFSFKFKRMILKNSYFVFHRWKIVIRDWIDMRVSKSFSFLCELWVHWIEGKARCFVFHIFLFKLTEGVELLLF